MPPDIGENFDPPIDRARRADYEELHADLTYNRRRALRPDPVELNEPPVGTVVAFSVVHLGGKVYDYASIRAGNGLWYTTGGRAMQGVIWSKLLDSVRERAVGPLRIMQPGQAYYF